MLLTYKKYFPVTLYYLPESTTIAKKSKRAILQAPQIALASPS